MAETKHTIGSNDSASTSCESRFKTKGKLPMAASPTRSTPRSHATPWDFTTDEIAATVLAELRL